MAARLLSIDDNAKTPKGMKHGYLTAVMYMAPVDLSGFNVCPMATEGCRRACLNTAGRGVFNSVQASRIAKTQRFFRDRNGFMADLVAELAKFVQLAAKRGLKPAVRLNGTSDILWERVALDNTPNTIFTLFPDVQFYDYTKHLPSKRASLPANYQLTYSYSDAPQAADRAAEALSMGWNVAVVFRKALPARFGLYPVVDGDAHDLRFTDRGVVVGLKAKGRAKQDTSGFVVDLAA